MNTTTDPQVRAYVAAIEARLDDLPDDERRDLLEDLEAHLLEIAVETEGSLTERLGPAASYAAELRSSAGLPPYQPSSGLPSYSERLSASRFGQAWRWASGQTFLREAWWTARGVLAAYGTASLFFTDRGYRPEFDSLPGIVWLSGWVVASIALGRRMRATGTTRTTALVLSLAALVVFVAGADRTTPFADMLGEPAAEIVPYLHHGNGAAISNICAYDSKKRPIDGLFLTDQNGRPIYDLASPADSEAKKGKDQAWNEFPRKQTFVEPNTGETVKFACPKFEEASEQPQLFGP